MQTQSIQRMQLALLMLCALVAGKLVAETSAAKDVTVMDPYVRAVPPG